MSLIIEHLEYLLRRHDCVTLPGIGALIARYNPAHFSSESDNFLFPPSRQLAFNGQLEQSDGLLERSVSRRCGISYAAASRIVAEETASLRSQLIEFGELSLGRLGCLIVDKNSSVLLQAAPTAQWDNRFYGLHPLNLRPIQSVGSEQSETILPAVPVYSEEESEHPTKRGIGRKLIGIAASLAVIITLALSLYNPVRLITEPEKASIAPSEIVVSDERATDNQSVKAVEENEEQAAAESNDVSKETQPNYSEETQPNYYVIVASFPDAQQANSYISQNPSRNLGVLNKDGKFRIYVASASTRAEAESLRANCGQADAWVCAR